MKCRPILFCGSMVRALLNGSKTQTRRIINPQPNHLTGRCGGEWIGDPVTPFGSLIKCKQGKPGDQLWVRETFLDNAIEGYDPVYFYRADDEDKPEDRRWKPSIFMPRAASRITLEITAVRVERLNDISEADAKAEGIQREQKHGVDWFSYYPIDSELPGSTNQPVESYKSLWESINGPSSWDLNPWVFCLSFKVV